MFSVNKERAPGQQLKRGDDSHLNAKLWRDLRRMKGQAIAVSLVMGCGLAMMIMARSLIHSLESTRQEYYEANRFAEVFVQLKRAPNSVAAQIAQLPGVACGPVRAFLFRSPWIFPAWTNRPAAWCGPCRILGASNSTGFFCDPAVGWRAGAVDEVLVGEAFAAANQLVPGNQIAMLAQR